MPLVYVPNKGPHNYSDAEKFGDVLFCTDGSLDKLDTAQMYRMLDDAMLDSHQEDFILIGSLTSLCCIACSIFTNKHGQLNLLIHQGGGYVSRSIYFT